MNKKTNTITGHKLAFLLAGSVFACLVIWLVFYSPGTEEVSIDDPVDNQSKQSLGTETDEQDDWPTIDELWLDYLSRRRQTEPKATQNVATIEASEIHSVFSSSPKFEEIVELTKRLRLEKTWTNMPKSTPGVYTVFTEYWRTNEKRPSTLQIWYEYELPIMVSFNELGGEMSYLHYFDREEAYNLYESNLQNQKVPQSSK